MVAVVNLQSDYNKKDYGFALYGSANIGDLVVVNPRGEFTLGTIKDIVTVAQFEDGTGVDREVIDVVYKNNYDNRVKCRELHVEKIEKTRKLKRLLDIRMDKFRDADYYISMAEKYKYEDSELVSMASELKNLSM
jgi:hypothetical protein